MGRGIAKELEGGGCGWGRFREDEVRVGVRVGGRGVEKGWGKEGKLLGGVSPTAREHGLLLRSSGMVRVIEGERLGVLGSGRGRMGGEQAKRGGTEGSGCEGWGSLEEKGRAGALAS
ncbi:hypothetical protein AMTR_s00082p00089210 [Amborella trichopoda]|uniref:Uncharacterized protein n=1 Tax=Amborella trichopoda TaxID=13333 RepID=W1NPP3_AMBTC|nr:hypothetical protein AMTR_s00082p00089210 [Amborella trichopoda]